MFKAIDDFIIDRIFQPIVDWFATRWGVELYAIIAGVMFVAFCSTSLVIYLDVRKGEFPYITTILLATALLFFGPHLIKTGRTIHKEGFASPWRHDKWSMFPRFLFLLFIILDLRNILFSEERLEPSGEFALDFSLWSLLAFMACRNTPPKKREEVPKALPQNT